MVLIITKRRFRRNRFLTISYVHNMKNTNIILKVTCLIAALFLLIGCFKLPIGYYTFLRIVVFITSIIVLIGSVKNDMLSFAIVTALIGILFNPILPIYLHSKSIWVILDILSAGWFIFCSIKQGRD